MDPHAFLIAPARQIPEKLLALAERVGRVRLRLDQLYRGIRQYHRCTDWDRMPEGDLPESVSSYLSGVLERLAGYLKRVEAFLRAVAFEPIDLDPGPIPEIQTELLGLAKEIASVRPALSTLATVIEEVGERSSALQGLPGAFASDYAERPRIGGLTIADFLEEADLGLRNACCMSDERLKRRFKEEKKS